MSKNKSDIFVYADWLGMESPKLIGILSAHHGKGRKSFSFEYDKSWLQSKEQTLLDPDLDWFSGKQFPAEKENFGVFLDSMPDTWGRTLMKRREYIRARHAGETARHLYDIDYLLGVYDNCRMGALRFKTDKEGPYLDNNQKYATPPWTSASELQYAAMQIEAEKTTEEINHWLEILMAPGSSLGGARPKANIIDKNKQLWIAKFPSKNDTIDKGLWEYLAYKLALNSGIKMSESIVKKVAGKHHTFFTKRFDRKNNKRIHFASAMTMTSRNEEALRSSDASYLELAEFISFNGARVEHDLHQLWRRIIFNIAISNTDDHLRNHGFVLNSDGWHLSPAYDINPSIDKNGLALNIDLDNNALDISIAKSIGAYFRMNNRDMETTIAEVLNQVSQWRSIAQQLNISRKEQEIMEGAFMSQ